MTSAWKNRVFIVPRESVMVVKDRASPMHLLNNGPVRLAFKLKSTQSQCVKPNVSTGFISANGGCQHILFTYKPQTGKTMGPGDRVTVLVADAPEGNVNWEQVAPNKDRCVRFVVKLREAGSPKSPKSESTESESTSGQGKGSKKEGGKEVGKAGEKAVAKEAGKEVGKSSGKGKVNEKVPDKSEKSSKEDEDDDDED